MSTLNMVLLGVNFALFFMLVFTWGRFKEFVDLFREWKGSLNEYEKGLEKYKIALDAKDVALNDKQVRIEDYWQSAKKYADYLISIGQVKKEDVDKYEV